MYRSRLAFALAMAALAAILLPSSLPAQIRFERAYGGAWTDEGRSVQQTTDGGYMIAGSTTSFGAGNYDFYLVKTDASGDTLWTKTYGGTGEDEGLAVQQTSDSGYIVAGYTHSFGAGYLDFYLIKTDAHGDTLWTRTFGGTNYDCGFSVQQTKDDGYIIAGQTGSFGAGYDDVYIVKTDASGDTLWTRTFGGDSWDFGSSVQQTSDGGYIIAGSTYSFGAGGSDAYLIKTDAYGDTSWTRTYGGADYDEGWSVGLAADSGYMVAGSTASFGAGYRDVYLIRTDASGDTLWTRTYGGSVNDEGWSVQKTGDGGYVIVGTTNSFGAGDSDIYLIRTDATGDTLWTRTYGGASDDWGYCVEQTPDGGYVIAGSTYSFGAGLDDLYLIKTDSLGNVAVAEPKAGPTRAPSLSLTCEPNPFRTRTAISLQLTADSPAELAIFDASGRCVRTLTVNRTPCTIWDGTDELGHPLPSGTYFAVLTDSDQYASARVILQR